MREIKFQFIYQGQPYSETNQDKPIVKKVYSLSEVCSKGLESICDVHGFMDLIAKRQYTGIEDKNGVEIYEGDIVEIPYINPIGKVEGFVDYKSDVKFKNGTFSVYSSEFKYETMSITNWILMVDGDYIPNHGNLMVYKDCVLKVIGNIYENPELLNNA